MCSTSILLLTLRAKAGPRPLSCLLQQLGILAELEKKGLLLFLDEPTWRCVLSSCVAVGGTLTRQIAWTVYDCLTALNVPFSSETYGAFYHAVNAVKIRDPSTANDELDAYLYLEEMGLAWFYQRSAIDSSATNGSVSSSRAHTNTSSSPKSRASSKASPQTTRQPQTSSSSSGVFSFFSRSKAPIDSPSLVRRTEAVSSTTRSFRLQKAYLGAASFHQPIEFISFPTPLRRSVTASYATGVSGYFTTLCTQLQVRMSKLHEDARTLNTSLFNTPNSDRNNPPIHTPLNLKSCSIALAREEEPVSALSKDRSNPSTPATVRPKTLADDYSDNESDHNSNPSVDSGDGGSLNDDTRSSNTDFIPDHFDSDDELVKAVGRNSADSSKQITRTISSPIKARAPPTAASYHSPVRSKAIQNQPSADAPLPGRVSFGPESSLKVSIPTLPKPVISVQKAHAQVLSPNDGDQVLSLQSQILDIMRNNISTVIGVHTHNQCSCGYSLLDDELQALAMYNPQAWPVNRGSKPFTSTSYLSSIECICPQCSTTFIPQLHIHCYVKRPPTWRDRDTALDVSLPYDVDLESLWESNVGYLTAREVYSQMEELVSKCGPVAIDPYFILKCSPNLYWSLVLHSVRIGLPTGLKAANLTATSGLTNASLANDSYAMQAVCSPLVIGWQEQVVQARARHLFSCGASDQELRLGDVFFGADEDSLAALNEIGGLLDGTISSTRKAILQYRQHLHILHHLFTPSLGTSNGPVEGGIPHTPTTPTRDTVGTTPRELFIGLLLLAHYFERTSWVSVDGARRMPEVCVTEIYT